MTAQRFALALMAFIALTVLLASVGGSTGDVAISGKLRYNALFQSGNDAPTSYEVSTLRYIVEAPPDEVGRVIPFDVEVVDSLCRDKDGCEVSLQMVNSEPIAAPGHVVSETSWLFLSEISNFFRFSNNSIINFAPVMGEDDSIGPYLTTSEWRAVESDCVFTAAETVVGPGDNQRSDEEIGFGLLNCENLGEPEDCSYDDAETTCRIVFSD